MPSVREEDCVTSPKSVSITGYYFVALCLNLAFKETWGLVETEGRHRKLAGIQEIREEWGEPDVMVDGDVTSGGGLLLNVVRKRNVATIPEADQCPPLDGHLLCLAVTSWLPHTPLQRSIVHFDGDHGLVTREVRWHPKARESYAGSQAAVLLEPSCVELKWKWIGLS